MQTNSFGDHCIKVGGVCVTAALIVTAVVTAVVLLWVVFI